MMRQPRAGLLLARWSPQGFVQHRGPDSVAASIPERAVLLTAKSSPRRRRQREGVGRRIRCVGGNIRRAGHADGDLADRQHVPHEDPIRPLPERAGAAADVVGVRRREDRRRPRPARALARTARRRQPRTLHRPGAADRRAGAVRRLPRRTRREGRHPPGAPRRGQHAPDRHRRTQRRARHPHGHPPRPVRAEQGRRRRRRDSPHLGAHPRQRIPRHADRPTLHGTRVAPARVLRYRHAEPGQVERLRRAAAAARAARHPRRAGQVHAPRRRPTSRRPACSPQPAPATSRY